MGFWPANSRFSLRSLVLFVVCTGLFSGAGVRLFHFYRSIGITGKADVSYWSATEADVARLARNAKSSSAQDRLDAALGIRRYNLEPDFAVPILHELAQDESADVRFEAIQSMVKYAPHGTETVTVLIDALADGEPRIRRQAASVLGVMGSEAKAAVPELTRLLHDNTVRVPAMRALSKMGPDAAPAVPAIMEFLDAGDLETCNEAIIALQNLGPTAAPAGDRLIDLLNADDIVTRQRAAMAIGSIGPSAVRAVQPLLEAGLQEPAMRRSVAEALANVDRADVGSLSTIRRALDVSELRRVAARLARRLGADAEPLIPDLVAWLQIDPPNDETKAIAHAIVRLGTKSISPLRQALRDDDPAKRALATAIISEYGPDAREAVPDLMNVLRDDVPRVRAAAALTLSRIGANARDAVPALVALFDDPDPTVRHRAAFAIGELGTDDEAPIRGLLSLLRDSNEEVRRVAAWSLSQIHRHRDIVESEVMERVDAAIRNGAEDFDVGTLVALRGRWASVPNAVPTLIELLKLRSPKFEVADALIEIVPDARDAIPVIIEYLSDDANLAAGYYEYAAHALRHLDPDAARDFVPELVDRLGAPERFRYERLRIVRTLSRLGPLADSAVPILIMLLRSEENGEVARTLGEIGPAASSAVPELLGRLKAGQTQFGSAYLEAIGKIGPAASAAVPALVHWLNNPDSLTTRSSSPSAFVSEAATQRMLDSWSKYLAQALGRIGPEARDAIPKLVELAQDAEDSRDSARELPSLDVSYISRRVYRGEYPWIEASLAEVAREALDRIQADPDKPQ
jgi:HEAT repeat protein